MGNFKKHIHPLLRRDKRSDIDSDSNFAVLNAIENVLNEAEKETIASKIQSSLESATGSFLDKWGDWFGIYRAPDEGDKDYREHIIDHTLLKRGTIESIIDAVKWFLKDNDARVEVYEPWRNIFYTNKSELNGEDHLQGNYYRFAIIDITLDRPFPPEIMDIIWAFKPAGVLFYVGYDSGLDVTKQWVEASMAGAEVTSEQVLDRSTGGEELIRGTLKPSDSRNLADEANIFRTNNSMLNGEDVLAGNINRGREFLHSFSESSGRNLLKDSKGEFSGDETYASIAVPFTFAGDAPNIAVGDCITIAFFAKLNVDESRGTSIDAYLRDTDGVLLGSNSPAFKLTTDYERFLYTFEVTEKMIAEALTFTIRKNSFNGDNTSTLNVSIKEIKIEKGNKATDWAPAPEDNFTNVPTIFDYNPLILTDTLNLNDIENQLVPLPRESYIATSEQDTLHHTVKASQGYLALVYDVRGFLKQNYKAEYEKVIGSNPEVVNKDAYSTFMKGATFSLSVTALTSVTQPVKASLRVFDYSTDNFTVIKSYNLDLNGVTDNLELGAIKDYLNAEGLITFQLVMNNKGSDVPVEVDYFNLAFANSVPESYGIVRTQEVDNENVIEHPPFEASAWSEDGTTTI